MRMHSIERVAHDRPAVKVAAAIACLAVVGIPSVSAQAAAVPIGAVNSPPANGHSIIAFPERDFIHGDGWKQGDTLTVTLWRGAVQIGVASGIVPQDDPKTPAFDGLFDLNHLGVPCWDTSTPDVLPGDVVDVTDQNGATDQTTVANVVVTAGAAADPLSPGTVVMHGTATGPLGALSPGEVQARIISKNNLFSAAAGGKRDIRATPVFDSGAGTWTATFPDLPPADLARAVGGESRVLWLGRVPGGATPLGSPIESTIYELGAIGGGAAGCPGGAPYAVTSATPLAVNIATVDSNLTLSGTSLDASSVSITLADTGGHVTPAVVATPAPATGPQTWSATVPAAAVKALTDGTLTATGTWILAAGTVTGTSTTLLKDLVAPAAPTASPAAGTFATSQTVSLSNTEDAPMLYTVGAGAPTTPYTGPLSITATQTVRAVTVDSAGNQSVVATHAFSIVPATTPTVPPTAAPLAAPAPVSAARISPASAPLLGSVTAGNARMSVGWASPAEDGSSNITGYEVQTLRTSTGATASLAANPGERSLVVAGLVNGVTYQVRVRAINAAGPGSWTALSAPVVPATVPTRTRILSPARGKAGDRAVSAIARWAAPADGGAAITGYRLQMARRDGTFLTRLVSATAHSVAFTKLSARTTVRFRVQALNRAGSGARSAWSTWVAPR
jgi:hypothetical protein